MATTIGQASAPPSEPGAGFWLPELPTGRYQGADFLALEMKHVWNKSWLFVGHSNELTAVGAFKLFQELGRSVIVIRGADNVIRAFHNTCRHRGAELLQESKGVTKRFVCPYHAWGYDLKGNLVSVPDAEDFPCLKKEEKSLLAVRCELWRGLIYINFDPSAMSLAEYMMPLSAEYADIPFEKLVPKFDLSYDLAGNWKAVYDNFLEGYHVSVVHARTVGNQLDGNSCSQVLYRNGHGRMITKLRRQNAPLLNGEMDESIRLSDRFKQSVEGMMPFPNGTFVLDSVSVSVLHFWPVGHDKTRIKTLFFALQGGNNQDNEEYWAAFKQYQDAIMAEDQVLLPGIQRNIDNGTSPTMVLKNDERLIHGYHQEIDRLIGPENIDPQLRVARHIPVEG